MGDSAKDKRREQLKRWAGSCTDKEPAVPRRRWRGNVEESEAVNNEQPRLLSRDGDGHGANTEESLDHGTGPLLKRRLYLNADYVQLLLLLLLFYDKLRPTAALVMRMIWRNTQLTTTTSSSATASYHK